MNKRINVILPESTLSVLDRVAPKGDRSRFISAAVLHFVSTHSRQNLAEMLAAGATANAGRDLGIAQEWFNVDETIWKQNKKAKK